MNRDMHLVGVTVYGLKSDAPVGKLVMEGGQWSAYTMGGTLLAHGDHLTVNRALQAREVTLDLGGVQVVTVLAEAA